LFFPRPQKNGSCSKLHLPSFFHGARLAVHISHRDSALAGCCCTNPPLFSFTQKQTIAVTAPQGLDLLKHARFLEALEDMYVSSTYCTDHGCVCMLLLPVGEEKKVSTPIIPDELWHRCLDVLFFDICLYMCV
jgi:hypothetical protein